MDEKLLDLAFYLCTAVGSFFIFGGLAAGSASYVSLGVFNLIVAYLLGRSSKNLSLKGGILYE